LGIAFSGLGSRLSGCLGLSLELSGHDSIEIAGPMTFSAPIFRALGLLFCFVVSEAMASPLVIAHRGASADAPSGRRSR